MRFFKEKEDTNIDKELEKQQKNKLPSKKNKIFLILCTIILIVLIIVILIFALRKPKIELLGAEKIILTKNSDYIEPGYIAYDKKKNNVTNQVKIISDIKTTEVGEYKIIYSYDGITKIRYVSIIEGDTYIYLNGNVNMYLEIGEKYEEPGYQVYDSINQNLTEKVKVTGSVDTSKIGTYQIVYSVVNSRNVTVTKKRTIIVVEKGQKPKN